MTVFGATPLGAGDAVGATVSPDWSASAWASRKVMPTKFGTATWLGLGPIVPPGPDRSRNTRKPAIARIASAAIPAAQTPIGVPRSSSSRVDGLEGRRRPSAASRDA